MDRKLIENQVKVPPHLRNDSVRKTWYLMYRWMEGTIYDDIPNPFHKDHDGAGRYIPLEKRRPATQWNLPAIAATQIARKLMAGRHAPTLRNSDSPETVEALNDVIDNGALDEQMKLAIEYGQAGASCITYKFLKTFESDLKLVTDVYRPHECWTVVDAARELVKLRICRISEGSYFIENGVGYDHKGDAISPAGKYWFIKDLTRTEEVHYYPIPVNSFKQDWSDEQENKLVAIEEGPFGRFVHGLKTVPAHWFTNIGGGTCTFERALKNVVAYDFTLSQMDLGTMIAATPHIVMQGSPVAQKDEEGKDIPFSPSKFLQFAVERKDDTVTIGGGDAKLLEPTGQGMAVGTDKVGRQIKKDAIQNIALSSKDPDKVTTAQSGKAMETVEEEFMDLIMDARGAFLKNGYLVLLRKIGRAAILCKHPKFKNVTKETLQALKMDYPQLHEMTAQEMQLFIQGLCEGTEVGILDGADAHDLLEAQLDTTRDTNREDVKKRVEQIRQDNLKAKTQPKTPTSNK